MTCTIDNELQGDIPQYREKEEDDGYEVGSYKLYSQSESESPLRLLEKFQAIVGNDVVQFRSVEEKFSALVEEWKLSRGPESSVARISMSLAYQQIIGIGPEVVPLILRELSGTIDHWFWALNVITGANPVPEKSRGILPEMAKAWIEWGKQNGYYKSEEED